MRASNRAGLKAQGRAAMDLVGELDAFSEIVLDGKDEVAVLGAQVGYLAGLLNAAEARAQAAEMEVHILEKDVAESRSEVDALQVLLEDMDILEVVHNDTVQEKERLETELATANRTIEELRIALAAKRGSTASVVKVVA